MYWRACRERFSTSFGSEEGPRAGAHAFQVPSFRVQGAVLMVCVLRACVVAAPRECSDRLVFGRKYVVKYVGRRLLVRLDFSGGLAA